MAALPRAVLCGIIPRTVRQNILDGARKWKGPVKIASVPILDFHGIMPQISKLSEHKLTSAGWVESSLLAHESLVLYYFHLLAIVLPSLMPGMQLNSSWRLDIGSVERTLRAEELSGNVESFASDDDYLLAVEQLLGHCARQATEEVSLAIDDNL
jgi:hypothetical protein